MVNAPVGLSLNRWVLRQSATPVDGRQQVFVCSSHCWHCYVPVVCYEKNNLSVLSKVDLSLNLSNIHRYTHTYIHTYIHTYMYIHLYIHTHTHTYNISKVGNILCMYTIVRTVQTCYAFLPSHLQEVNQYCTYTYTCMVWLLPSRGSTHSATQQVVARLCLCASIALCCGMGGRGPILEPDTVSKSN